MVHQSFVSLDDMRSHLLTLDQVRDKLAATEPLSEIPFPAENARVRYEDNWAEAGLTEATEAYLQLPEGKEYKLTKQAALQIGAACHVPRALQEETDRKVLAPFVNWWLASGLEGRDMKALSHEGSVLAVTRGTVSPFSNTKLLEVILGGIEKKYGKGEVLADYKFHHDLERTNLRLIVPAKVKVITGTPVDNDTWAAGIDFRNSLVGLRQTDIQGYLFRYWCTNGACDVANATHAFPRRGQTEADALEWAAATVDEVLGGLEDMFSNVQKLPAQKVDGDVRDVLEGIFTDYGVPVRDRHRVIEAMADDEEMTAYSLMQAVTQAANLDGLDPSSVDRLLRAGGHIAASHGKRCNLGKLHRVHDQALTPTAAQS